MNTWTCKVGEVDEAKVPAGGDLPMRLAVERAFKELTGEAPEFNFSGWGGALTEIERAVVERREPEYTKTAYGVVEGLRGVLARPETPVDDHRAAISAAIDFIEATS